jgi:hypothetical protein
LPDEGRPRRGVTLKSRLKPAQLHAAGLPKGGGCKQKPGEQDNCQTPESGTSGSMGIVLIFSHRRNPSRLIYINMSQNMLLSMERLARA